MCRCHCHLQCFDAQLEHAPGYGARPVVFVARGMKEAYTAHTLSVCSPVRTNAHAHAPTPTRPCVHSNAGFLFVDCLNTSVLLPCCLCSVDGALTESGNFSDVWNVSYSSAHYTTESRRGTRTMTRQNSLSSSFSVRSELTRLHHAVSGKRKRRTLLPSVHSSESGVGIRA